MRTFIQIIMLACAVASVVATIPEIPTLDEQYFGFMGYPYPKREDLTLAKTIEILSKEKATPRQTMLLINSAKNSGFIFKSIHSLDFVNLNEYPQDGNADQMECIQEEIDSKTKVCDKLELSKDESILYQNLNNLCLDLKQKLTDYCSDKMVEFDPELED